MAAADSGSAPMVDSTRLDLYRYVTAEHADDYIAIMGLFTATMLADLSAAEVAEHLTGHVDTLSLDDVEARCRQLEQWGNLVRSVRDARVATVADYLRSRSRFQVSKLGGQVHRQVEDIVHAAEGAREVARELLGGMVGTVEHILSMLTVNPLEVEALAAEVTTVFANQRLFTESVRDFYAYLHQVLSRYDLVGEEYAGFKTMLLQYVELISADVARHAPSLTRSLDRLTPHLDVLLEALATLPTVTNPDGTAAEHSPGRTRVEWEEFSNWYSGRTGRSGPQQLRDAAEQALAQLLNNAKRMLASAGTGVSRRNDLLRLAGWFDGSSNDEAHRLFNAAFGTYPVRHLGLGPHEAELRASAVTSWWNTEPVEVPLSLRERGDRAARGRTSRVPDPGLEREAVLAQSRQEAQRLRATAAELAAAGDLHGARLSPAARDLLLELLADLLSLNQDLSEPAETVESDLGIVLRADPQSGATTVVDAADGALTVEGLRLTVTALAAAGDMAAQAAWNTGAGA
jgi:uncharacterized protein (TIGR02677 family)